MSNEKYTGAGGITLPNEQYPAKITSGYYRVREENNEDAVEIGAYRLLANAIKSCDEHPGSCVYADAGIRIYPEDSSEDEPVVEKPAEDEATGDEPAKDDTAVDEPIKDNTATDEPTKDNTAEDEQGKDNTATEDPAGEMPETPKEDSTPTQPGADSSGENSSSADTPAADAPTEEEPENTTVVGYAKLKTLMNVRQAPDGELVTTYKAKTIVAVVEFCEDGWLKILCPESDSGIAYVSNENGDYAFVGSSIYTVKRGDNVWKIAEEQLGDGTRCNEISTLNSLVSNRIQVGMELLLP